MPDDPKTLLRREVYARLKALDPGERLAKSQRAWVRLLSSDEYRRARTVAAYSSFGDEFPTRAVLDACLSDGKTLGLPRLRETDSSLTMHLVSKPDTDLETNRFGIAEPKAERPVMDIVAIDLIIVPGLAFDLRLNRLGRGAGYYDRFLAHLELNAAICALAFECQIVDNIPTLPHDRPVQAVFTEDRTIR